MTNRTCSASNCDRERYYQQPYCRMHARRMKDWGRLERPTARERFMAKVAIQSDGCWLWTGAKVKSGYGRFRPGNETIGAHVYALSEFRGVALPRRGHVDHACHNTLCVNPDHLRPTTAKQNGENRRGANANSKSGIRGVYFDKRKKRWFGQCRHHRKQFSTRYFRTIEEAEAAVIDLRNQLYTHNDLDRTA